MNVLVMIDLSRVSIGAGPQPATALRNEDFHTCYSRSNAESAEKVFVEPIIF